MTKNIQHIDQNEDLNIDGTLKVSIEELEAHLEYISRYDSLEEIEEDMSDEEVEASLWREPHDHELMSPGDDLMTVGWED